jgi:hypothetical protein
LATLVYGNHEFSAKGNVDRRKFDTIRSRTLIEHDRVDHHTWIQPLAVDSENGVSMFAAKPPKTNYEHAQKSTKILKLRGRKFARS